MKQFFESGEEARSAIFPGYMLIEMELSPEAMRLVLRVPRVLRFLGGKSLFLLSQKEIDRIFSQM